MDPQIISITEFNGELVGLDADGKLWAWNIYKGWQPFQTAAEAQAQAEARATAAAAAGTATDAPAAAPTGPAPKPADERPKA